MARLTGALIIALALTVASPASAQVGMWSKQIEVAANRFGVPESWIRKVMQAESAGRTRLNNRPIVSRAGAMGLMQLMPGTWADMRRAYQLGSDPFDPADNILAGTAYLRAMYDRFGYPGLFAAYNAGPARYQSYLRGRALPLETRNYVRQIAGTSPMVLAAGRRPEVRALTPQPSLFAIRGTASVGPPDQADEALQLAASNSLFAPQSRRAKED